MPRVIDMVYYGHDGNLLQPYQVYIMLNYHDEEYVVMVISEPATACLCIQGYYFTIILES